MTPTDRRLKILIVDAVAIMNMLKEGMVFRENFKIIHGVPADARLLGMSVDHATGYPAFVVWSAKFPNVPEDEKIPAIEVRIAPFTKPH